MRARGGFSGSNLHLIKFEFVQVGKERVHGLFPNHLHGRSQSFEGRVTDLKCRVVHLLWMIKQDMISFYDDQQ